MIKTTEKKRGYKPNEGVVKPNVLRIVEIIQTHFHKATTCNSGWGLTLTSNNQQLHLCTVRHPQTFLHYEIDKEN
jgi:hypothetical protein